MPNLAELTDYDPQSVIPEADGIRRVYITGNSSSLPVDNTVFNGVPEAVVEAPVSQPSRASSLVNSVINKLFRDDDQRYQLWPEKVVREALTGANKVMEEGSNLGLRREDVTDIPAPTMPTKDSTWLGEKLGIAPVYATPQDSIIEKAQAISALAGTGGLAGSESGAVLNATPSLRPALKYKDRLYKGKPGQEHQDVIPAHLYPEFQQMAMSGEDISHYNFGFVNDKGHFLTREDALKYGIDNGLIDPQAGKYGALTSTLMADSSKPGTAIEAMAKTADPFFSALEHNVKGINQAKMNGDAWLGTLSNKPGVKPEELEWTGLKSFLEENKGKPVTKAQIEEHLASNKVELKEVSKGGEATQEQAFNLAKEHGWKSWDEIDASTQAKYMERASKEGGGTPTKYHSYQLPGGENYREMLLTLPDGPNSPKAIMKKLDDTVNELRARTGEYVPENKHWDAHPDLDLKHSKLNDEYQAAIKKEPYRSSHWDEPNILAHVRMNDRTIDGKKSLHVEEIQSDWHQQGRDKGYVNNDKPYEVFNPVTGEVKGTYKTEAEAKSAATGNLDYGKAEGVPDAPFKKTWHELALKRMIREAAEKGYDRLSWTPGEAQAARYDLSKQIGSLKATPIMDQHGLKYEIRATNKAGTSEVVNSVHTADELPNIVGKEMAKKIVDETQGKHSKTFKDLDLKVGGEGMKGFYDQIIPKAIEKLGKEHGVKVKQEKINKPEIVPDPEVKDRYDVKVEGKLYSSFSTKAEAEAIAAKAEKEGKGTPVYYIDIPQSLRDTAMHKGFPLFSSTHMFVPVDYEPEFKK